MRLFTTLIIVAVIFGCCHARTQNDKGENLVVQIQPFGNFPQEDLQYVYNAIKKHYPYVTLTKPLPLPKKAYYAKRNRYKADSLLTFLSSRTGEGEVIIGLTEKDISTTKDKVKDWGILGLGQCPGKSCVASTYRLSKEKRQEQLFKVCIHELGHTQGLKHCPVTYCFMHDEEGRNTTDEQTDFCPECKALLISKGWRF
jgi:archaemetzincin